MNTNKVTTPAEDIIFTDHKLQEHALRFDRDDTRLIVTNEGKKKSDTMTSEEKKGSDTMTKEEYVAYLIQHTANFPHTAAMDPGSAATILSNVVPDPSIPMMNPIEFT